MNEPQSEAEASAAFEAWASDPEAVAALEVDLVAEEAADPALASQGQRVEAAAREWLAAPVVDAASAKLERRFPGMWDTEDGPTAYEVVVRQGWSEALNSQTSTPNEARLPVWLRLWLPGRLPLPITARRLLLAPVPKTLVYGTPCPVKVRRVTKLVSETTCSTTR